MAPNVTDDNAQGVTSGNRATLRELMASGAIRLHDSPLFDTLPAPLPPGFSDGRVEGMLLGLAIGDALGNTSESQLPSIRKARYGEIRDYLPNKHAEMRQVGLPSDDSQMAFWLLEQLIEDGHLVPDRLAQKFTSRRIFGIGQNVKEFVTNYKQEGRPWYRAGNPSAGNGALMRIAPIVAPYIRHPSAEMFADAALAAMLTHNDYGSTSACVAFTAMLWELLGLDAPPDPTWWVHRYVELARPLEGDQTHFKPCVPDFEYEGPLWRFVDKYVTAAWQEHKTVLKAGHTWYSGAYLLETLPSVLYILMRHAHDPEEAIVRAVNDTKDNDSVAAIVGAAVGALHGVEALPARWRAALLGRTGADDDAQVFRLIAEARRCWWE